MNFQSPSHHGDFLLNKGSELMKKLLLASVLSVLPFVANAEYVNIKPLIGLDYSFAKMDLKNGWDQIAEHYYSSFSGIIGVKINDAIGFEIFYQQSMEEKTFSILTTSFNAFGFDALSYIPLGETLDFIPSVGLGGYKVKVDIDGYGSYFEDGLGFRAGLGMQFKFNENVGWRIGGRFVLLNDFESVDNIMEFSTGLRFTF